jgi:hypothetical protein
MSPCCSVVPISPLLDCAYTHIPLLLVCCAHAACCSPAAHNLMLLCAPRCCASPCYPAAHNLLLCAPPCCAPPCLHAMHTRRPAPPLLRAARPVLTCPTCAGPRHKPPPEPKPGARQRLPRVPQRRRHQRHSARQLAGQHRMGRVLREHSATRWTQCCPTAARAAC